MKNNILIPLKKLVKQSKKTKLIIVSLILLLVVVHIWHVSYHKAMEGIRFYKASENSLYCPICGKCLIAGVGPEKDF